MNTLHVEDFVVLGRTVPEESKKYGKRVCMAGYSAACNQLLRVYPLMVPIGSNKDANGFTARHKYTMDLIRNPQDSRTESWRVVDEMKPTATAWSAAEEVKKERIIEWLEKRAVPSIQCLNQCKLSLGVLFLKAGEWEGVAIPKDKPDPEPEHAGLFEDLADQVSIGGKPPFDPTNVKFAPYMKFTDGAGSNRRLQVREWGAYLLLGNPKYADTPDVLWDANGYKRDRDTFVVVGNMTNRRNNWLIIKLFQPDKGYEPTLFDGQPEAEDLSPPSATTQKGKRKKT